MKYYGNIILCDTFKKSLHSTIVQIQRWLITEYIYE